MKGLFSLTGLVLLCLVGWGCGSDSTGTTATDAVTENQNDAVIASANALTFSADSVTVALRNLADTEVSALIVEGAKAETVSVDESFDCPDGGNGSVTGTIERIDDDVGTFSLEASIACSTFGTPAGSPLRLTGSYGHYRSVSGQVDFDASAEMVGTIETGVCDVTFSETENDAANSVLTVTVRGHNINSASFFGIIESRCTAFDAFFCSYGEDSPVDFTDVGAILDGCELQGEL